jgi:hypothetical protein
MVLALPAGFLSQPLAILPLALPLGLELLANSLDPEQRRLEQQIQASRLADVTRLLRRPARLLRLNQLGLEN